AIFTSFPKGFDPYLNEPTWSKRGKWNYHHMCRFWFKLILDIPLINKYDYIMRLDSDSKVTGVWFNVFDLMKNKTAVNFANVEQADTEAILPGLMKLKTFTLDYQKKYGIIPKNPIRLTRAFDIPDHIRLHNTNFDIFEIELFKSQPVTHWINAVDKSFGYCATSQFQPYSGFPKHKSVRNDKQLAKFQDEIQANKLYETIMTSYLNLNPNQFIDQLISIRQKQAQILEELLQLEMRILDKFLPPELDQQETIVALIAYIPLNNKRYKMIQDAKRQW
ncbi:unnamed protein product, partial [Adineta steineri]